MRAAHLSDASLGTEVDTELFVGQKKSLLTAIRRGPEAGGSLLLVQTMLYNLHCLRKNPIDIFFDKVSWIQK